MPGGTEVVVQCVLRGGKAQILHEHRGVVLDHVLLSLHWGDGVSKCLQQT